VSTLSGGPTVIALDVGGTAMKGAVLRGDAAPPEYYAWSTPRADGPDVVVAAALHAVDALMLHAPDAVGVGLVVPGFVDDLAGVAVYSENIGWRDVAFRDLVHERTGLPVGFGHDVRAGGLAERTLGAARGVDDVLFLPIGTGISGIMYVGGRLVEGRDVGEIGHIDVGFDVECACGGHGCLEAVASAASVARRYSAITGIVVPGAKEVLDLAASDDPVATRVWDDAVTGLARALATYVSLLCPERIVIGGGLSGAGEALLDPLRQRLRRLLVWQREPDIVTSLLADKAACLGAGLMARRAAFANSTQPSVHTTRQPPP
jgi:glucokinase